MQNLQVSICRVERYRTFPNYEPAGWERAMGNGRLYSLHSKDAFVATGNRHILAAAWNTHLGHFQVNYWFQIPPIPAFGHVLDATPATYEVLSLDLDHFAIEQAIAQWIDTHKRSPDHADPTEA